MRLLALLGVLPAIAFAQSLDITVTKPVECTRKTRNGDTVSMKYKGTLQDGTEFDSNYGKGKPFKFTLGAGQVIAGWDQGLLGMCIAEGRKLIIPPNLAYGGQRVGPIPAGSTLSELLSNRVELTVLTWGQLLRLNLLVLMVLKLATSRSYLRNLRL